jgi:hypothetical protein
MEFTKNKKRLLFSASENSVPKSTKTELKSLGLLLSDPTYRNILSVVLKFLDNGSLYLAFQTTRYLKNFVNAENPECKIFNMAAYRLLLEKKQFQYILSERIFKCNSLLWKDLLERILQFGTVEDFQLAEKSSTSEIEQLEKILLGEDGDPDTPFRIDSLDCNLAPKAIINLPILKYLYSQNYNFSDVHRVHLKGVVNHPMFIETIQFFDKNIITWDLTYDLVIEAAQSNKFPKVLDFLISHPTFFNTINTPYGNHFREMILSGLFFSKNAMLIFQHLKTKWPQYFSKCHFFVMTRCISFKNIDEAIIHLASQHNK